MKDDIDTIVYLLLKWQVDQPFPRNHRKKSFSIINSTSILVEDDRYNCFLTVEAASSSIFCWNSKEEFFQYDQ